MARKLDAFGSVFARLVMTLAVAGALNLYGQSVYRPLGPSRVVYRTTRAGQRQALLVDSNGDYCQSPPTEAQVRNSGWNWVSTTETGNGEGEMANPILKGSVQAGSVVVTDDFEQSVLCKAYDGNKILVYGWAVEIQLIINNYQAQSGFSLGVLAANGTLGHSTTIIASTGKGVYSAALGSIIASLDGSQLTVQNYAAFVKARKDLIRLVTDTSPAEQTSFAPTYLGELVPIKFDPYFAAPAAFALTQLAYHHHSCWKAVESYDPSSGDDGSAQVRVIEELYEDVAGACSSSPPAQSAIAEAKKELGNVRAQ